jgi:hypothetical protein
MKWVPLILLTIACTSNKPEKLHHSLPSEAPAEIKSCLCNKIFMPVCADGIPYPNPCEAACQGHKKWTNGRCLEK